MNLKQWSIPVERTYAAPAGKGDAPRSIRAERRVDLIEQHDRLHVYVDGRKVVHKESDDQLTFGIGKYGCIIRRSIDDYELSVGGKRIDEMPSVFPVSLHTDPPPPPSRTQSGPIRVSVSPRLVVLVATLLLIVVAWNLRGRLSAAAAPPSFREIASSDGRFTANMPGVAATRVDIQTKDALTLALSTTSVRLDGRGIFGVVWADLPTNADGTLPVHDNELATMCSLAMNALIVDGAELVASPPDIKFTETGPASEQGTLGCQLGGTIKRAWRFGDIFAADALYGRRLRVDVRGVIVGHRLYVRAAITDAVVASTDVQRFFDSVHIEQ
jgi:hypothetical protein